MKYVGITQRVDNISGYSERRDGLDQQWYNLLLQCDYIPVPIPNIDANTTEIFLEKLKLDAVIFTGGNSLLSLDDSGSLASPEREVTELSTLKYARKTQIPVIGVCRGMQLLNDFFGGALDKVAGHIATRHKIERLSEEFELPSEVNSFHSWAIRNHQLAETLEALAVDEEGNVESFKHHSEKIYGILWHPERELPFNPIDISLLKRFLND